MNFIKFYIVREQCAIKISTATGRVNIRICREDGPPTCPYLTVRSGGKDRRVNLHDEQCGG